MAVKSPGAQQLKIAREAAEFRMAMVEVWRKRGLSEIEAHKKAAETTDAQLAMRMQELEKQRAERLKYGKR